MLNNERVIQDHSKLRWPMVEQIVGSPFEVVELDQHFLQSIREWIG